MEDRMTLDVFIGYDGFAEPVAYHVCCDSIIRHASCPIVFHPLALNMFPEYKEKHGDGSNSFTYSRFLVPYLMGYKGQALFLDGDMIVRDDVAKLFVKDSYNAVRVVKHAYKTRFPIKYMGQKNEDYPRKNWSSVMLFNCWSSFCHRLTPQYVAEQSGEHLHRFQWVTDDRIGELPPEWNRLVLEDEVKPDDKLLHYTIGTPCFSDFRYTDDAEYWHEAAKKALSCKELSWKTIKT